MLPGADLPVASPVNAIKAAAVSVETHRYAKLTHRPRGVHMPGTDRGQLTFGASLRVMVPSFGFRFGSAAAPSEVTRVAPM